MSRVKLKPHMKLIRDLCNDKACELDCNKCRHAGALAIGMFYHVYGPHCYKCNDILHPRYINIDNPKKRICEECLNNKVVRK
jgi:hypothetical protein